MHGRYTHPSDPNPAPLDPNFDGFAAQATDAEGRFKFKTINQELIPNLLDADSAGIPEAANM